MELNVLDYIVNVLEIDRLMKDLKSALLKDDFATAKDLCLRINAESRLLHQQIKIQEPQ